MTLARPLALLLLIAAALFQTGALALMITDRAALLRDGREVILRTGFVDPRDLFRGHYVTLNLTISQIVTDSLATPPPELRSGADVWAELAPADDGFWTVTALHEAPPDTGAPVLRGVHLYTARDRINVRFPVDRYFAPKLRAKELEKLRQDNALGVILALDPTGEAAIKGITLDGTRVYEEPLF